MAEVISPLLKQGLSPFQNLAARPELNISEKTLYNYIENGVFHEIAGTSFAFDTLIITSNTMPKFYKYILC